MSVSVDKVLHDLGWKDGFRIPVANEENKRFEIELEKKNNRKARLLSELCETEERIKAIDKHAANIDIERDYNQKLITAHAAQLEAEDNLGRVRAIAESAILQEIRDIDKEKNDVKDRNNYLEKEIAKLSEKIDESKKSLQFDKLKLVELEKSLDREEGKSHYLEFCMKLDAEDFKKLELERSRLIGELGPHRRAVVRAGDEINEMEIMLDRTAKMYVETLREQLHLINRWKQSVCVLNQRDNGIQQTLREIETLRELSNEKTQLLRESEQFLKIQINVNDQSEEETRKLERKLVVTKNERLRLNRELVDDQLELKSQTRTLEMLGKRIRHMRTDAKLKIQEIEKKRMKVEDTRNVISKLRTNLETIGNQNLNVGDRLKQLEDMIEKEEKRKIAIMKETRRYQDLILRMTNQMCDLETQKKTLELRKQSEIKKSDLLAACETRENKRMSEKKKLIYHLDIDIEKCETRLELTSGTGGMDRTEMDEKLKTIEDLEKLLSTKKQDNKILHTEITNLEYDMRKVSNSLSNDSEELDRLRNKKQELGLLMEGGEKQRKTILSQNEERQVEESILGLRVSQAERLVASLGDKVYNLDKYRLQIESAMKERKTEIKVHKESLNLQKRIVTNDCAELRSSIAERKFRIKNLQSRYEIGIAAMGTNGQEDGTPITTTYMKIQSAQERYLLREEGDKLDATIRRTENEIRSMENTLRIVNACNDKYKTSLEPVDNEGTEQMERRKLDDEMYKAIDDLKNNREKFETIKNDIENIRKNIVNFVEQTETAKNLRDKKLLNVANLENQIDEQKRRILRAEKLLKKLFKDIQRKCECTDDETIILQEKDIATRELQEQNHVSLQRVTEFTIRHVEAEAYVKKLLSLRNINLPCAQHLKPSPGSSKCDVTSEISERTRSRISLASTSRESVGRIRNFDAQFAFDGPGSTRKNVTPAEQSTRSTARSQQSQKTIVKHSLNIKK